MVQMDAAPVSTAAVASSRPREDREAALAMNGPRAREGGLYNDFQVSDPIEQNTIREAISRDTSSSQHAGHMQDTVPWL